MTHRAHGYLSTKVIVGYSGDEHNMIHADSEGRLKVCPQVVDPDTLELVPQQQGGGGSAGGDVNVLNWPATQPVSGPLTDAQLRAAAVPVQTVEDNKAQVVYEDGDVLYVCRAAIGTALAAAAWQIKKVDCTTGVIVTWCDGNANYDNVATSLAVVKALSYS